MSCSSEYSGKVVISTGLASVVDLRLEEESLEVPCEEVAVNEKVDGINKEQAIKLKVWIANLMVVTKGFRDQM